MRMSTTLNLSVYKCSLVSSTNETLDLYDFCICQEFKKGTLRCVAMPLLIQKKGNNIN
jgi:hypothetical protein